jgi:hypothetical protein
MLCLLLCNLSHNHCILDPFVDPFKSEANKVMSPIRGAVDEAPQCEPSANHQITN